MATIRIVIPYRGKIIGLDRILSNRDGTDQIRIHGDPDDPHAPPDWAELFAMWDWPQTATVSCRVVQDLDDGDSVLMEYSGPQDFIDKITFWAGSDPVTADRIREDLRMIEQVEGGYRQTITRQPDRNPKPNRDGLVEVDMRGN